ncbi:unnamed protein product, partial [Ranitomeya imitator]
DSEELQPESEQTEVVEDFERTPSGRVRRHSAQVAVFHLQEIAEDELAREGRRRRKKEDLVPDTKRLNYLRPGLPTFNPQLLDRWKALVKENGFICCPNNCCEAIYSSVSGLKAHLANCNKGHHSGGKYSCLLCKKEFSSESGVKYHILKTHSQNWFRMSAVSSASKRKRSPEPSPDISEIKAMDKNKKMKLEEKAPSLPPTSTLPFTKETPFALKTQTKKSSSNSELFMGTTEFESMLAKEAIREQKLGAAESTIWYALEKEDCPGELGHTETSRRARKTTIGTNEDHSRGGSTIDKLRPVLVSDTADYARKWRKISDIRNMSVHPVISISPRLFRWCNLDVTACGRYEIYSTRR